MNDFVRKAWQNPDARSNLIGLIAEVVGLIAALTAIIAMCGK